MSSLVQPPPPSYDILPSLIDDLSQRRFSMSLDVLQMLQQTLQAAQTLIQEALNSRNLIAKLPPELLSHIFSMVSSDLPVRGPHKSTSHARQTYDLIPLTHVCHRWRTIALTTSSLWSTVCETTPTYVASEALRARAGCSPLTIYLDRPCPTPALSQILAKDGEDVVELYLNGLQGTCPVRLASELLAFQAPHLEHARVMRSRPQRGPFNGAPGADADMSAVVELWHGTAPRLRTLELYGVPFLPSNHFERLAGLTLSLDCCAVEWGLDDLCAFFARAPALEELCLEGLPADLHLRHPFHATTVALPKLRRLTIGDFRGEFSPASLLCIILAALAIPPEAAVHVQGLHACQVADLTIPVFGEHHSKLVVDMSFTTLSLTKHEPRSSATFSVEVQTGGATRDTFEQAIRAFIGEDAAASVRELVLSSQRAWSAWCDPRALLAMVPRLAVLELPEPHLLGPCIDALRPVVDEAHPDTADVPCRELTTLRVPYALEPSIPGRIVSILKARALYSASVTAVQGAQSGSSSHMWSP
ncbi:hypothetical protein BD413DRAFT_616718 [Trametes elegans]|nr:hypothetical protein BD413DRAFT_616718 [Trametes elegans]